jgi:hypothetical protein
MHAYFYLRIVILGTFTSLVSFHSLTRNSVLLTNEFHVFRCREKYKKERNRELKKYRKGAQSTGCASR